MMRRATPITSAFKRSFQNPFSSPGHRLDRTCGKFTVVPAIRCRLQPPGCQPIKHGCLVGSREDGGRCRVQPIVAHGDCVHHLSSVEEVGRIPRRARCIGSHVKHLLDSTCRERFVLVQAVQERQRVGPIQHGSCLREEAVLYAGSGTVDNGFCNQGSAVRSPLRARRGKKTAPCGKRTGWLSERAVHILSITVFFCASRYDGLQSTSSVHQCAWIWTHRL